MLDCSVLSRIANKVDALSNLSFNFSIVSRLYERLASLGLHGWKITGEEGMENLQRTFDGDVAAIVAKVLSIEKHNRGLTHAEQTHVSLPPSSGGDSCPTFVHGLAFSRRRVTKMK